LRKERRLKVFKNRVLRIIFGPKSDEVTGEWRKLRSKELNDLYSSRKYYSGNNIEKNEMGGTCSKCRGEESFIQGFGGET